MIYYFFKNHCPRGKKFPLPESDSGGNLYTEDILMCKEGKTSIFIFQPTPHIFWVDLGLTCFPRHIHSKSELEMNKDR
jgi:hypothetical protein